MIDWRGWKRWAFPLIVAGVNPITLYLLWQLAPGLVRQYHKTHLGQSIFESAGSIYVPLIERAVVLLVFWLIVDVPQENLYPHLSSQRERAIAPRSADIRREIVPN